MSNMGTLATTNVSNSADKYVVRQSGIDYVQTRDTLAAAINSSSWTASADYATGVFVRGSDSNLYVSVQTSGISTTSVDPTTDTDWSHWQPLEALFEVSPRNNDWNGYLDPEHQSILPSDPVKGYPTTGGVVYAANEVISFGIRAGSSGQLVKSDPDGWTFTGSIYKLYDYTTEQLDNIDVTKVPIYLKDQDGIEYFVNNSTTGVNVTKVGSQLKVEITYAIFSELGITKLWRFFPTEVVGRVVELSAKESLNLQSAALKSIMKTKDVTGSRAFGVEYPNNLPVSIFVSITTLSASTAAGRTVTRDGVSDTRNSNYVAGQGGVSVSFDFEVPPGGTYEYSASFTKWTETGF
ncbi:hypothetical protein VPHG_00093 [Vibrio phage 11895-B1]|uniref:hypothetical protein n=1 Tax=Vibrio phage 11895-B1 TaxID=754075 RepID=UPI0002C13D6F|nr:hypothetical protein VPHG_00093 [Vibrio phage 11895-B1]AGH32160.1 hypothetical protein VPHG_00093 [Vibrio phage 11895-B1]